MLADADGPGVIVRKVQVPQGVTMWFVSLPVQLAMVLPGPAGWVIWLGVAVYLVGLFFEAVGDSQLAAFKKDPANKGKLMDRGLWRYTRHPNYFGDACVWVGIFLTVSWTWVGWLTILSPVLMIWLLTAKTGKALTEKRMSSPDPVTPTTSRGRRDSSPPLKKLPPKKLRRTDSPGFAQRSGRR